MTSKDTVRAGRIGKDLVMQCLHEVGYRIRAVPNDSPAARQFIDCVITDPISQQSWSVFIVSDARAGETANTFIERCIQRKDPITKVTTTENGWLYECKADILAYLDVINGTLRLYDWHELMPIAMKADIGYNTQFRDPVDYGATVLSYIVPAKTLETYVAPDEVSEPDEEGNVSVIKHNPPYLGMYTGIDTTRVKAIIKSAALPF